MTVDLWSADGNAYSVRIGELSGKGPQDFAYLVPKVAANLDYRVRAGDTSTARFHIKAVSPLAYARIDVAVAPPKGIDAPVQQLNGLTDQVVAAGR